MRGSQKEVMSMETTLTYWAFFSLWFIQVGRGMPHTVQWCSVLHLDATIKAPIAPKPNDVRNVNTLVARCIVGV